MSDLTVYRFYSYVPVVVQKSDGVISHQVNLYRKQVHNAYLTESTRNLYKTDDDLIALYKRFVIDEIDYIESLECVEDLDEHEFVYFDHLGCESDALTMFDDIVIDGNYSCVSSNVPVFHKWED
jgi:hypothetical protein